MMKSLSTFNLAVVLDTALAVLPDRYFVCGHGSHARRMTSKVKPEGNWKECKSENAAKAALTRRFKTPALPTA
jgi:hypothetical protein